MGRKFMELPGGHNLGPFSWIRNQNYEAENINCGSRDLEKNWYLIMKLAQNLVKLESHKRVPLPVQKILEDNAPSFSQRVGTLETIQEGPGNWY